MNSDVYVVGITVNSCTYTYTRYVFNPINTGSRDPRADKTWRCVSQNCCDKTDKIYGKTKVFTNVATNTWGFLNMVM